MKTYRLLGVITLVSALAWSSQQPTGDKSTTVNPDDEIVRLNKQLQTSPDSADLHHQLALIFAMKGDWAGSDKEMSTAMKLDPHNPILFIEAAEGFRVRGLKAKAIEMLTRAVGIDPQNPLSHFFLGVMYERESTSDKAIAEFRETKRLIDTLSLPASAAGAGNRIIKGTQGETWYHDQFGKEYLLDGILKSLRKKLA